MGSMPLERISESAAHLTTSGAEWKPNNRAFSRS